MPQARTKTGRRSFDFSKIRPVVPIPAAYTSRTGVGYNGNPLCEAIAPPPTNDKQAAASMRIEPAFDLDEIARLSKRQRLDCIDDLDLLHVPTTQHIVWEQKLTSVLMKGLRTRNPVTPEGSAVLVNGPKNPFIHDPGQQVEGSICLVDAMSGMGKTTLLKAIARTWGGPVIEHRYYGGRAFTEMQIVYLRVNCPEDGSLKSLASNIFFAVVQLVGADKDLVGTLLNPYIKRRDVVVVLRYLISTYHIGVLVIDEIRNLWRKSKRKTAFDFAELSSHDHEIVAFLMNLRDEVKVPVVLVGTPEVVEFLQGSLSSTRRLAHGGIFGIKPPRSADDPDWILLCSEMWKFQWTVEPVAVDSADYVALFHDKTAGITGLLILLFQEAQRMAINLDYPSITPEVVSAAYETHFSRLHPILVGIKSGDPAARLRWTDIWTPRAST